MTRAVAATMTAMERAIKANEKTGSNYVIQVTRDGGLLLIPAKMAPESVPINDIVFENQLDEKEDLSF